MCWNQGDWRFYWYYRKWQKKTASIASKICKREHIDILHQLNMIGFREPGYLADVSKELNIPLVWGPIGGLKQFPMAYANNWRMKITQGIKNTLNIIQLLCYPRVRHTFNQADVLISSIPDSYKAIKKYIGKDSYIIPETGCFQTFLEIPENRFLSKKLNIVWGGKFDFRKRLDIAIKTIAFTKNENIHLTVYGSGNEQQTRSAIQLVSELKLNKRITLKGNVSTNEIHIAMRQSDLFFFTSVSEDTSTVVLEAISNGLPVLCFDTCGMAAVIDNNTGKKIPLTNPLQSIKDFAEQINYLEQNRTELLRLSSNCTKKSKELSWENKGKQIFEIYKNIKNKHH